VEHALVGGVSNGSFLVHYWTITSGEVGSLEVNSVPRQDLRLVMKPGVYGRPAQPLKLGTHIGREAVAIRPTVVSVGGLYPALGNKTLVSVCTRFDDLHWCDRSPEVDELLQMWDVPEIVSKGLSPEDKAILEVSVKVPMRVRRAVCISLTRLLRSTHQSKGSLTTKKLSRERQTWGCCVDFGCDNTIA
jgi:hypothetical protein